MIYFNINILIQLIFICFFSINCFGKTDHDIIGDWEKKINDSTFIFNFDINNDFNLFLKTRSNNERILTGSYELDFTKTPITLSITGIKELETKLHTIINFIDHEKIIIAPFSHRWRTRPIAFESKKNLTLMKNKN